MYKDTDKLMIDNTINDAKTVAGDGKDMVLAGRYHILRRLGQGIERNLAKCIMS